MLPLIALLLAAVVPVNSMDAEVDVDMGPHQDDNDDIDEEDALELQGKAKEMWQDLLDDMDSNHDGLLSLQELEQQQDGAAEEDDNEQHFVQKLEENFGTVDEDHDGNWNLAEFATALKLFDDDAV